MNIWKEIKEFLISILVTILPLSILQTFYLCRERDPFGDFEDQKKRWNSKNKNSRKDSLDRVLCNIVSTLPIYNQTLDKFEKFYLSFGKELPLSFFSGNYFQKNELI